MDQGDLKKKKKRKIKHENFKNEIYQGNKLVTCVGAGFLFLSRM